MIKLLAPLTVAALLLTGCSATTLESRVSSPAPTPQSYVDVTGSVRLPAEDGYIKYQIVNDPGTGKATRCNPMDRPGVKDLMAGGAAKLITSRDQVIEGEITTGDWDGLHCSMRVTFKAVPAGLDYYSIFVGHRTETRIFDVTVPFELRVGD